MPDPDYTAWPTDDDVWDRLASANVTPRIEVGSNRAAAIREGVIATVGKRTHRQFLADTADSIRYFDGSGTGIQEVDEMVSLTQVDILGYVPAVAPFTLTNVLLESDNTYPQARIAIYQASLPSFAFNYINSFPEGRKNIKVTGKFGYAVTIPQDLWDAVAGEIAARLTYETIGGVLGRLIGVKQDDVDYRYDNRSPAADSWHDIFTHALTDYARPVSRRLRRQRPRMI